MRKKNKDPLDKEKNHAITEESSNYQLKFVKCSECPRCGARCVNLQRIDLGFGNYLASVGEIGHNNAEDRL